MKVKSWILFLTIFLVGIIQSTALNYLSALGAKPDFLLIAVIFFTLYFGKNTGVKTAIFGGLFKDVTSTAIFGSNAFAFCLCVLFLARYGRHFYKQRIFTQVLLCGLLYYITTFLILFINYGISKGIYAQLSSYPWMIFKAAIYTGFISPLLFFILSRIFKTKLTYA